jgi:hypothetical protein
VSRPTGDGAALSDNPDSLWTIGPIVLGSRSQTAAILPVGYSVHEVAARVDGPHVLVPEFAVEWADDEATSLRNSMSTRRGAPGTDGRWQASVGG